MQLKRQGGRELARADKFFCEGDGVRTDDPARSFARYAGLKAVNLPAPLAGANLTPARVAVFALVDTEPAFASALCLLRDDLRGW